MENGLKSRNTCLELVEYGNPQVISFRHFHIYEVFQPLNNSLNKPSMSQNFRTDLNTLLNHIYEGSS